MTPLGATLRDDTGRRVVVSEIGVNRQMHIRGALHSLERAPKVIRADVGHRHGNSALGQLDGHIPPEARRSARHQCCLRHVISVFHGIVIISSYRGNRL